MRTIKCLVLLLLTVGLASPAWGKTPYLTEEALHAEIRQGLEEILDLWREGQYGELYERTATSGKKTKEIFGRTMAAAPLKPACCWEKIQEVKIALIGDSSAKVRARLGFEGGMAGTEFKTRTVRMVKEFGIWRMSQNDFFTLAEATTTKQKRHRQKKLHRLE
jgi:hypothetical protein